MSKYKVQATPIRDDETGDVIGWLDQLLIMDFMLRLIAPNPSPTISWATHWGQPDFSASLEQKFTALERETCGGLMKSKMSEVAKFYTVLPSTSLKTLVDTFFHREVHRVGVVNEGQILVDVVTQSDVVAFLARYANSADPVMHSTIQTLELGFPRYNWVDSSGTTDLDRKLCRTSYVSKLQHRLSTLFTSYITTTYLPSPWLTKMDILQQQLHAPISKCAGSWSCSNQHLCRHF
jgi:hypothetical protein